MAKRIKTVFSSDEIPHLWAHNLTPNRIARNAQGNYHFAGELLYSYREEIARRIRNPKDSANPVFLIREFSYSVTTSRHQSGANSAVFGTNVFRHVASIGASRFGTGITADKLDHKANLAHYAKLITEAGIKFTRCRAATKEWRMREVQGLVNLANRYAEYFKLKTRFEVPNAESIAATIAKAKADLAKRTREQVESARKATERAEQVRQERNARVLTELPKWLAGEPTDARFDIHAIREATGRQTDYMRVEGTEVVTQRGARVPLHHVKRVLPFILKTLRSGVEWTRGETSAELRVSEFRIEYIGNGGVSIGCHRFDTAEIERIAGVVAIAPDSIV